MGAGAKIGASAIPVALAADGLKKDPFSAGQQPPKEPGRTPSGPTALEKALCKVRQEQECAKKKPKVSSSVGLFVTGTAVCGCVVGDCWPRCTCVLMIRVL